MKVNATTHMIPRNPDGGADYCAAKVQGETVIAVLADGAGAARGGAEAARRIVESIVNNYTARPRDWSPQRALGEFARTINQTLYRESLARYDSVELVSTLSVAVVEGNHLYGLNIGDSRVFLASGGKMEQLSVDHVDTEQSHVLSRAVGLGDEFEPHFFDRALRDGDVALLCSDGVSNLVGEEELRNQLVRGKTARTLVQHAREQSNEDTLDDMSAVVIDMGKVGLLHTERARNLPVPEVLTKGMVVDGYELIRSFTGTDRVWLANKEGRRWTLKFAPLEAKEDENILAHFIKEAWNASRVQGDAFVEAFIPEGATARYYVQEFVEAPSLKTLLKSRRMSVDEAIALAGCLCEAGMLLLQLGLVHGDLKPENIMADTNYDRLRFKLIDLGCAAEVFSVTSRAGTASYLAPERFHGAPVSERTEIFAIGVTLYEALAGTFPYGEIERFQTPVFHAPKRITALNPNLPAWLEHVILRAISIDPASRYQHYSEMVFDIANPKRVEPFFFKDAPLIERDPLKLYRTGFWLLFGLCLYLLFRLISQS